jgi:hypothetical protein
VARQATGHCCDEVLAGRDHAGWVRHHDRGTDPCRGGLRHNGQLLEPAEYPTDHLVLVSPIGPYSTAPRARLNELLAEPRCWSVERA